MSELRTECFYCKSKKGLMHYKKIIICEYCAVSYITEDLAFNYVLESEERQRDFYKQTLSSKGTLYQALWNKDAMYRIENYVRGDIRNFIEWLNGDPYIVTIDEFRDLFPIRKEAINGRNINKKESDSQCW